MKRSGSVIGLVIIGCSLLASSAWATDYPVFASQLTIRNRNDHGSLSLVLPRILYPVPAPGNPDDPSLGGMTLTVFSRGTGQQAAFQAPPGSGMNSWKVRTTPNEIVYAYRNGTASTLGGDIHTASLRTKGPLKVHTRAAGLALDGPQSAVAVRVEYGSIRVCALFGGVKKDIAGFFRASGGSAAALSDCDDATLAGTP